MPRARKEIQHYWMDNKVREEVVTRPRGPVMKSLAGRMTDFEPFSSVIGVIEGITWSELYYKITSPAAPSQLGFEEADEGARPSKKLYNHPSVR